LFPGILTLCDNNPTSLCGLRASSVGHEIFDWIWADGGFF
jgi:hypothetical protein